MNKLCNCLLVGTLFTSMAASVFAHHSAAIYDMSQTITVVGTVTRYAWANPHVYIHIEQTAASGEITAWAIEGFPPAAMRRIGWAEQTLKPGDSITVVGNPTRRTSSRGIYPATIEAGGLTLFQADTVLPQLASGDGELGASATSLEGTWETLANVELYLLFFSLDSQLTEAGRAARNAYDEASMLPALQCIPYSSPLLMIDPDFKQIRVEEDVITISGGFAPAERRIYMDIASHEDAIPSVQGHSTGRWEGETLVIDTTSFAEHRIGNGYRGVTSSPAKHLVERLMLVDDGRRLSYSFELTDAEMLTETITGTAEWIPRADLEYVREPCDADNATEFLDRQAP